MHALKIYIAIVKCVMIIGYGIRIKNRRFKKII
jgi:hypothetical protein